MPVTARLSKHFYERLGEQATNELVDWFNAVDTTSKAELRGHLDLRFTNFELRFTDFESKLEQRLAELRADLIKWMFLFWAGTTLAGLLTR